MAIIKSFTDIEQSKKLAKILPLESADMKWFSWEKELNDPLVPTFGYDKETAEFYKDTKAIYLPCWSLAALLSVLPSSIKDSIGMVYSLNMNKEYIEYSNPNISSLYSAYIHTCGNDNLVDACYEMILKLHERKILRL